MAVPALRADLRRIDNLRNAPSVATVWFWVALIIGGAVWIDQWWGYLVAFVLMGPMYARFAILMHEAAHKLLFTNKRWNNWSADGSSPTPCSRRCSSTAGHFAHHKDEFGPDEPDIAFYVPYPCTRRALWRRLVRDAVGISGSKTSCRWSRTPAASRSGPSACPSRVQAVLGPPCGPPPVGGGSTRCCGSCPG